MARHAYPSSYTRDAPHKEGGIFHALGKKIRQRFSRFPKPIDHLGGINPEACLPPSVQHMRFNHPCIDENKDLEPWPKAGTSHEDMEICIG
ncbi:MAG: hypothetical protein K0R76_1382 [Alphaproteobacteria bacterium]|jgi:hypothetical protein|nr:hypothetical protein [Alphaproteobacteria bacterium]MDF3034428.1 hypothetical protein [Alphaproteobacteria bacterium]